LCRTIALCAAMMLSATAYAASCPQVSEVKFYLAAEGGRRVTKFVTDSGWSSPQDRSLSLPNNTFVEKFTGATFSQVETLGANSSGQSGQLESCNYLTNKISQSYIERLPKAVVIHLKPPSSFRYAVVDGAWPITNTTTIITTTRDCKGERPESCPYKNEPEIQVNQHRLTKP